MNVNRKEFMDMLTEHVIQVNPDMNFNKKDVEYFYEAFLKTLTDALVRGDRVFFSGFGAFSVKERAPTTKTSPQNPSIRFQIPSKKVVRFKPSDKLGDIIN